ncbi:MgtC family protein [Halalkalicoccus paucihalophilus]|uniref:MgtC family protein n=1 Tax=Halalkalicoccus paucihalophilus TaxID=1008153 RepID=A0A151AGC9_9EURY|nr:MgtC/SapB family protein [Halalkalicoccus paucihalophilus]KYH26683.1 MgtC family protein [Halalkalicoccus paucihalophilus]
MNSVGLVVEGDLLRIVVAGALGLFLGLEREWSHKSAGIRTFSLISLLAAVFTVLDQPLLLAVGGLFVAVQGLLLAVQGLLVEESGLSLTTSVSMLVAYGIGVLVGTGRLIEGVTVAILSSLLLVLKRELHSFAWGLSREELRSTAEFAVLAFVVYPLLPAGDVPIAAAGFEVAVEPRVIWLMVVTVAGIGIVNYAIVSSYGGRGIAVTGFFGGLASSTAVVGTMLDHVRQHPAAASYAVAAILLADAAMAVRNLGIALAFTIDSPLVGAIVPLAAVVVGAVVIAAVIADWSEEVEMDLVSPFSLRNALGFGAIFLLIVVSGALAEAHLGTAGFYATAVLSGLVSSAGATTSAVVLYRTGSLDHDVAVIAILLATASSLVVKAVLVAASSNREFARQVGIWTAVLLGVAGVATAAVLL